MTVETESVSNPELYSDSEVSLLKSSDVSSMIVSNNKLLVQFTSVMSAKEEKRIYRNYSPGLQYSYNA